MQIFFSEILISQKKVKSNEKKYGKFCLRIEKAFNPPASTLQNNNATSTQLRSLYLNMSS